MQKTVASESALLFKNASLLRLKETRFSATELPKGSVVTIIAAKQRIPTGAVKVSYKTPHSTIIGYMWEKDLA